jgi:hypothetical protein
VPELPISTRRVDKVTYDSLNDTVDFSESSDDRARPGSREVRLRAADQPPAWSMTARNRQSAGHHAEPARIVLT